MNITLDTLRKLKAGGDKFACLTAYDAAFAHAVSTAGVEVILVGDSLGMVLQGRDSTLPVTVEDMVYHTRCVARGNQGALIMADLPFGSYSSPEQTLENSAALMRAGAHLVKLEGGSWLCDSVQLLARNGIPACVHLGLTPQSVNVFGGFKVQGRNQDAARAMVEDGQRLDQAGAALLLLECVPSTLAREFTQAVSAPVIGIGAGGDTDGQVLVLHDMLGVTPGRRPRFVKNFMEGQSSIENAIKAYSEAVKSSQFPAEEHQFTS
ncbi:3-methyl-2-oxobutanoate hydroxymethyltransferase [Aestuariirhabdus litorea]|uniref:3-methyl-2-oxobutanoate hydroxymethyltransferase n=1 Tax=Aestuariirhabdus litorea TaxID=2528527 RepID=A0A3P3VN38_9GAMM|nr:3-methyl-2-oxobutanoate hydroxymethyltransferase [Aestuariirhabdus litorea]RRJ82253.1 3-methyl-2-oxobutanoate hydroxymethyltransferase [Aestuariirhabdus litorea]RWW93627.1 3-methyl-2-oxobutanoate hydroxymethyltransferase [Endozoicomonadaceae bacterium GTF-13]